MTSSCTDDYARYACELFACHPEIVAASGNVLVDASIPRARAVGILAEARIPKSDFKSHGRDSVLYGCNMMLRREAALHERFDEALPLYSFGEDYAFQFGFGVAASLDDSPQDCSSI